MPPITLTQKQFYNDTAVGRKPGAQYANYLSYIAKRRPPNVPVRRPAAAPAAPVDPMSQILSSYRQSILTPSQVSAFASKSVADQIAASIAANKAGNYAQDTQLGNQADRAQGFALALGQATAPNPDQVKGYYQEAADRLRGYGTGLTGAVAADQQTQADATKAAVDRVTGGQGVTTGYDPNGIRNTAQMTGVVIPGSSLESQAASAATEAQFGRAASAANIGQIAQDYLAKQNDARAQLAAQNVALEAQRPSLFNTALSSGQQQRNSALAAMVQAEYLANTMRSTGAGITGVDPLTGKPTVAATTAKKSLAPIFDASRSGKLGYRVDQYGQPLGGTITPLPGFKLNKAGTGVVKTAKPVNLTADARRNLQKDLTTWTTVTPKKQRYDATNGWMKIPGTGSQPLQYDEVVQRLMTGYGLSQAQAQGYVNKQYKIGQYGRPYPVQPPDGTLPLSETEVVTPNGATYKLVGKKWVLGPSVPQAVGATQQDSSGNTYVWNGQTWEKQ